MDTPKYKSPLKPKKESINNSLKTLTLELKKSSEKLKSKMRSLLLSISFKRKKSLLVFTPSKITSNNSFISQ
ncbi:hypothetical protein PERCYII40_0042 [Pseudomonas aeruginosa]|nr:hypothetical protein HMPREF3150_04420 [Pseudomonas aeruginosa]VZR77982.1 hypothetical protein PERCYII40_0042 [Pseudomonas aeruginosa]